MVHVFGDRPAEPMLEETQTLRSTIYQLSEGVVVADREGRFLICNQAAGKVLAIATGETSPQSWASFHSSCFMADGVTPFPPENLPSARALAGESAGETEIFVCNAQCPKGIWINAQSSPLRNEAGEIRGSIVTFHDVTKKKEADTRIRTLTNAVEQTADGIIITDRGGLIEYVNPAFLTMTGYAWEELKGATPRILKSGVHDDSFYEKLWAAILSGQVFRATIANRKKNGEIFFAEQTITPMWSPNGAITHFVTVIKDVTELRQLQEQQLQMSLARAVQQQIYSVSPPPVEGLEMAGAAFPADATGGDYFDFIALPGGRIGIVTGDVSGHGIGSALLMVELRAYIRAFAQRSADVGEILTLTNNALVSDLEKDRYATLIFCCYSPASKSLVYASAGHTSGYILDANGAVKNILESTDIPLGFMPKHAFVRGAPMTLDEGEILALLTDGITDAERPDETSFGIENALEYIRAHRHESAQDIVAGIYEAVREFSDGLPQSDDITAVICKAGKKK